MYDRPAGGVKLGWPYKKHFCGTFFDESMLLAENAKILCCHIESDIYRCYIGRGGDVVVIGGGKEGSELLGETRLLNAEKCYRFNAPYCW